MIEINDKCTGCMACRYACPKLAIKMKEDAEGFLFPEVDKSLCIECGLCVNICPIDKPIDFDNLFTQEYFAAKSTNRKRLLQCQSGGLCDVFSEKAVADGNGVVYGVGFDEQWNAIHKRATDCDSIKEFRGSKYVQSNIEHLYETIISDIKNDNITRIIVTGTACQIAGVKAYIKQKRKPTDKVIFVDLICHGVPSPKIWREYLETEKKTQNLISVKFRNKEFGWSSHIETYYYNNKRTHSERFTRFFYMEVISRKCCSTCKYTSYARESDITVADFWGYKKAGIKYDSFGISECLINTRKGKEFFDSCANQLEITAISKELADQWNLNKPTVVDAKKRKDFWTLYLKGGYIAVRDAYCQEVIKKEKRTAFFYYLKAIKRFITEIWKQ